MASSTYKAALGLRRALIAQLETAATAFDTLPEDEAVHEFRVRLKRARALAQPPGPLPGSDQGSPP